LRTWSPAGSAGSICPCPNRYWCSA
jgi:hypothetical protein